MTQANKMGTQKMLPLIFNMTWPPFCSMMMAYSYNLVDSMFVSWAGHDELAAVSLAFPLNTFMVACAIGFGVGINVLVSRHLGEKDQPAADEAATNGLVMAALIGVFFNVLLLLLAKPYFTIFLDDPSLMDLSLQYTRILTFMMVPVMLQIGIQKILQGTGNMIAPMWLQMSGVIFNFVLDPALIFGWGPFPELGVRGAAIATVFGYTFSGALSFYVLLCRKQKVKVRFKGYKLNFPQAGETIKIGMPSFLMNVLGAVMVSVANAVLVGFSITAVSFFGAYFKVQQIVERGVNSLVQGVLPIMSFNYGAKDYGRLHQAFRLGIIFAVIIMGLGTIFILLFPELILSIFKADAAMIEIGVPAMRIMVIGYVFAGVGIICATYMQAIKNIRQSIIINLLRQAIVLLPLMVILAQVIGIHGVWIAYPVAEIVTCIYGLAKFKQVSGRL
ncbi:MAG: MATE family efflux transporter [Bacillota bacterium]|nr:MATE family efflux transporter [Bacillota bacterium]